MPASQNLRAFRQINRAEHDSPIRQQFKALHLREKEDPDHQYFMSSKVWGAPLNDKDLGKQLGNVDANPIIHNFVRGADQ